LYSKLLNFGILFLFMVFLFWICESSATQTITGEQVKSPPKNNSEIAGQLIQYFNSRIPMTFLMAIILYGFKGFAKFLQQLKVLSANWQDVPIIIPGLGLDLIPISIGFVIVWLMKDRNEWSILITYAVFALLLLILIYLVLSSLISFAIEQFRIERRLGLKGINNRGLLKIGLYDLVSVLFFVFSSIIFAL